VQRVKEVAATRGESLELAHGWVLRAIEPLTLAEARTVLAEPAASVPASAAARLGKLRIFAAPFISCQGGEDFISVQKPEGEMHSSVWLEKRGGTDLFLAFFDMPEHDVGFELLAAVAELVLRQMTGREFERYLALLERELREAITGEIDEEALEAKQTGAEDYPLRSFCGTFADYVHALWHDVEIRQGEMHLPARFLRKRFELLRGLFPPNPGYALFKR